MEAPRKTTSSPGAAWMPALLLAGFLAGFAPVQAMPPVMGSMARHLAIETGLSRIMLDETRLRNIGFSSLETHAPWMPEPRRVRGIVLADLLRRLSLEGEQLCLRRANGSAVGLPLGEVVRKGGFLQVETAKADRAGSRVDFALVFPRMDRDRQDLVTSAMSVRHVEVIEIR
ncbi:MAG: hypothetical protein R3D03_02805 [Geminicoccaceae bacterium]|nr:hypothetical protein [Geminicoccaceae bacterium]